MSLFITSIIVSFIAAIWVWVTGRKDPCGRPWLTGLSMALLLLLPLLSLLPKLELELIASQSINPPALLVSESSWGWSWLTPLWLIGVSVMLLRYMAGQKKLSDWLQENSDNDAEAEVNPAMVIECSDMLGLRRLPVLKFKKDLSSPVVARLRNPVILLPEQAQGWSEQTQKMAILHEMGHVKRKDLWLRTAADITCALHWYNPLVWWMRARLLTQCEYACDAQVIKSGANPKAYIRALCDVVESSMQEFRPMGVSAMADHAPLKLRVDRLLAQRGIRHSWLAASAASLTVAAAFGLTVIRPAESVGAKDENPERYTQAEIELRHTANPFPGSVH